MVIYCLNYDALDIHSCLTVAYVYNALVGVVTGAVYYVVHGVIIKWTLTGIFHEWKRWLDRHPLRRINFYHNSNRHPAPSMYVCDDGECKMIALK